MGMYAHNDYGTADLIVVNNTYYSSRSTKTDMSE